jgi:hypothetical protein
MEILPEMTMTVLDRAPVTGDAGQVAGERQERPDPEVPERARRRTFTAQYKLDVLAAYDAAGPGEKGAILLSEGNHGGTPTAPGFPRGFPTPPSLPLRARPRPGYAGHNPPWHKQAQRQRGTPREQDQTNSRPGTPAVHGYGLSRSTHVQGQRTDSRGSPRPREKMQVTAPGPRLMQRIDIRPEQHHHAP